MKQRTLATLILILITFVLTGTAKGQTGVWNPLAYAIVGQAGEWDKQHFTTIQAALDSGATHIVVRPGTYPESPVINTAGVTIEAQGAVIPNDGTTCAVTIAAPHVTIQGDLLIQGSSNGTVGGYYGNGTGFCINASYAHLDGVRTSNLYSFAVLAHDTADHITLERFEFTHICTAPVPQCYANPAIQFMGSSYNTVRNGLVRGHSGGLHTWYGASHTEGHDNRFEQNYGFIGQNGEYIPRAIIENYGLGDGNIGNRFYNNVMDGSNGNGLEEADVTHDTVFSNNTIRNAQGCFGVSGSADNKARGILIEENTCYGGGVWDKSNWFSGEGVIRGNRFVDYREDNIGTIYIPDNGLGGVIIENNSFERNGRVMRIEADGIVFRNNQVTDGVYHDNLYITGSGNHRIEGNRLEAQWHTINGGGAGLVIRDNVSSGGFWVGAGNALTITGNDVTMWGGIHCIGIIVPSDSRVTDNRVRCDGGRSILIDTNATGILIERNHVTALDGSAIDLPYCNSSSTCTGNWTAGQVPPPTGE